MIEKYLSDPTQRSIFYLSVTLLIMIGIYAGIAAILRKFGKNPKYMLPANTIRKVALPLMFILFSLLIRVQSLRELLGMEEFASVFRKTSTLLFIVAFTWLIIRVLGLVKKLLLARYDIGGADNLKARKVFTQFTILERIVIFLFSISSS